MAASEEFSDSKLLTPTPGMCDSQKGTMISGGCRDSQMDIKGISTAPPLANVAENTMREYSVDEDLITAHLTYMRRSKRVLQAVTEEKTAIACKKARQHIHEEETKYIARVSKRSTDATLSDSDINDALKDLKELLGSAHTSISMESPPSLLQTCPSASLLSPPTSQCPQAEIRAPLHNATEMGESSFPNACSSIGRASDSAGCLPPPRPEPDSNATAELKSRDRLNVEPVVRRSHNAPGDWEQWNWKQWRAADRTNGRARGRWFMSPNGLKLCLSASPHNTQETCSWAQRYKRRCSFYHPTPTEFAAVALMTDIKDVSKWPEIMEQYLERSSGM